jgi:NTP pyrophosphatase (non-canonical NTP hydrolase)
MTHFEFIWNEAESVSKSFINLNRKKILKNCRNNLNDLSDSESSNDYTIALGDLLFQLCSFCAYLQENHNIEINSAEALINAIERKRLEVLDINQDT